MALNKKGVVFTLIAIALLSLFMASYSVYSFVVDRTGVDSRVETMNRHVFSLEEDFSRKLYISSFRIIFIYEKRIAETGSYISDVDSTFEEALFNGTILGVADESEQSLLSGVLFEDIVEELDSEAEKINLDFNFTNPSVSIGQADPWNVLVNITGQFQIEDRGGLASWNRTASILAYIPIESFEDPIYVVNTNGLVPRRFNQSIYLFSSSDLSNLTSHLEGKYYVASNLAPSFIDRLEGDFSADPNGIESLVYLPDLAAQGIALKDKSVVDYIYFSSSNPSANQIVGMPSWFKLESNHYATYNLS
jgi:hypothetical protein